MSHHAAPPRQPAARLVDHDLEAAWSREVVERGGTARVGGEPHPEVLTRGPERLPLRPVVLELPRLARRREVHAAQSRLHAPLELFDGRVDVPHRQVHQPEESVGRDAAEVSQPHVVDVVSDLADLELALHHRAEALADPGHVLAVLGEVPDHLGGDTVPVHVGEPRRRVVVPGHRQVRVLREPGRALAADRVAQRGRGVLLLDDVLVERLEVLLRAVVAQLLAEQWPHVRVGRDDDRRRGRVELLCHRTLPGAVVWEERYSERRGLGSGAASMRSSWTAVVQPRSRMALSAAASARSRVAWSPRPSRPYSAAAACRSATSARTISAMRVSLRSRRAISPAP